MRGSSLFAACFLVTVQSSFSEVRVVGQDECRPWQFRSGVSGKCKCAKSLQNLVLCQNDPYNLELFACFCMSYKNKTGQYLVGSCQYTCQRAKGYYFDITANGSAEMNRLICDRYYHRQGQLCGSCKPGYAPPVYSYSLNCVKCSGSHWMKYIAVSLVPLTILYIVIIVLRLSVTSPMLNGLIIFLQLALSPPHQRIIASSEVKIYIQVVVSLYGIWNLDFFRLVYTPFCLRPNVHTLKVLALDYLVAVYPIVLICLSYLLVSLYDHNVRIIFCLFKPIVSLFIRFRRQWNIRHSLVDAFATFLLLSYVKILSVSVDLLTPVVLYDQTNTPVPQLYLFNQGDMAYLSSHHLPYACLAVFFLLTFTLVPMLLLFLYPCSCFQVCLNRTGRNFHSLHTFMDTFQGHYKNGTDGTRDFRFFSGLYLLLRVLVYGSTVLTYQISSCAYTTAIIAVLAISVALARPYRRFIHNFTDVCFLTLTQLYFITLNTQGFGRFARRNHGLTLIDSLFVVVPFLYMSALLAWQIVPRCLHNTYDRMRRCGMTFQVHKEYELLY